MSKTPKKLFFTAIFAIFQCHFTIALLLYVWRERGERGVHFLPSHTVSTQMCCIVQKERRVSSFSLPSLFPPRHRQMCYTVQLLFLFTSPCYEAAAQEPDIVVQKKYTETIHMWKKKIFVVHVPPAVEHGGDVRREQDRALFRCISQLINTTEQRNIFLIYSHSSYRELVQLIKIPSHEYVFSTINA